jgi:hypothetical protein
MSEYDPSELLSLCESIIEDGELTYEEIYQLAEWLNHHEEACHCWPGNQLIAPLQKVWADGKITKTEAREIARLILRVQKESAKREAARALTTALERAITLSRSFDPTEARLPLIPFSTSVKSRTDKGVTYDVDLQGPTCTCPDFRTFRHRWPVAHLTRCCKHVLSVYQQLEPSTGWPGWLRAFVNVSWTPHPKQDWMVVEVASALVLISTAPDGWANAYVSESGPYDRYGYHVRDDRWSYGIEPPKSDRIRHALVAFSAA